MWVRIDEISFAADRADDVIAHTRNNAVATHQGESFLGFRLLVDRPHGRALNVSYWDDLDEATRNKSGPVVTAAAPGSVPFALSFDRDANLLVAGAAGVASSYSVHRDGTLTAISTAVPNGQSATCWTVFARGHLYAANAGSATITGYTDRLGKLIKRQPVGAIEPAVRHGPDLRQHLCVPIGSPRRDGEEESRQQRQRGQPAPGTVHPAGGKKKMEGGIRQHGQGR